MNKKGQVKIADFGLSRILTGKGKPLTIKVSTFFYRAPEIVLGMPNYSFKADVWSVGCILAELLMYEPLFCTAKNINQLVDQMFCRFGTPDEQIWPGMTKLQFFEELNPKKQYEGNFGAYIYKKNSKIDKPTMSLLYELLKLNPASRISASDALNHEFFTTEPLPCNPSEMPKIEMECHDLDARKAMQQKKEKERQALLLAAQQAQAGQLHQQAAPHGMLDAFGLFNRNPQR